MRIHGYHMTLALTALSLAVTPAPAQVTNQAVSTKTNCRVDAAELEVFQDYLGSETSSSYVMVILTETESADGDVDDLNLSLAAHGRGIPPDVRADFKEKNKLNCAIHPLTGRHDFRVLSTAEHHQIFKNGWTKLHKIYGRKASLVQLSRVGFNHDGTLALLHVSSGSGAEAAGGALYLLERKERKWVIKAKISTWTT